MDVMEAICCILYNLAGLDKFGQVLGSGEGIGKCNENRRSDDRRPQRARPEEHDGARIFGAELDIRTW